MHYWSFGDLAKVLILMYNMYYMHNKPTLRAMLITNMVFHSWFFLLNKRLIPTKLTKPTFLIITLFCLLITSVDKSRKISKVCQMIWLLSSELFGIIFKNHNEMLTSKQQQSPSWRQRFKQSHSNVNFMELAQEKTKT